jgi:hypothetical protein
MRQHIKQIHNQYEKINNGFKRALLIGPHLLKSSFEEYTMDNGCMLFYKMTFGTCCNYISNVPRRLKKRKPERTGLPLF